MPAKAGDWEQESERSSNGSDLAARSERGVGAESVVGAPWIARRRTRGQRMVAVISTSTGTSNRHVDSRRGFPHRLERQDAADHA